MAEKPGDHKIELSDEDSPNVSLNAPGDADLFDNELSGDDSSEGLTNIDLADTLPNVEEIDSGPDDEEIDLGMDEIGNLIEDLKLEVNENNLNFFYDILKNDCYQSFYYLFLWDDLIPLLLLVH